MAYREQFLAGFIGGLKASHLCDEIRSIEVRHSAIPDHAVHLQQKVDVGAWVAGEWSCCKLTWSCKRQIALELIT